jgi:hypothetical protein
MATLFIVTRLIHIVLGVFWAGTIFFVVIFLEPSVRAAGPDGARVMQGLQQRHYMNVMPIVAGLTILSGLALYWWLSGGLEVGWITSNTGMSLTIGGVAAILAFIVGLVGMRRAALKAGRLGMELQQSTEGPARDALQAEMQALRVRARRSAHWVAALLIIAVVAMAVGRYL